jgi:hypothetical protein
MESPKVAGAYSARYWPSNVRFVLQQVKAPVVPGFFLLDSRTILVTAAGIGGWLHQILPKIPGMLSGEWFAKLG